MKVGDMGILQKLFGNFPYNGLVCEIVGVVTPGKMYRLKGDKTNEVIICRYTIPGWEVRAEYAFDGILLIKHDQIRPISDPDQAIVGRFTEEYIDSLGIH